MPHIWFPLPGLCLAQFGVQVFFWPELVAAMTFQVSTGLGRHRFRRPQNEAIENMDARENDQL